MFTTKAKFNKGDIAIVRQKQEKVCILKPLDHDDNRNVDLGQMYLIRGEDNKIRSVYEIELDENESDN